MGYLESISLHRIGPPAVTGREVAADLIDHAFSSYNAGRLREVCQVFTRKFLEPDCTVGLTHLRRPHPGRAGHELPDPPDQGRVRRLDRLHRRQPLPRHPLRARPAAAPEPAQPRRLRLAAERRHPDLRHRLRLQDAARHRRVLPRADPRRGLRPADGDGRVPSPGRAATSTPGPRAWAGRPTACWPRPSRRRADLHLEPRRQLDRHEPRRAQPAGGQAPDRHAPRRQRDRRHRLRRQDATAASRAS